MTIVTENAAVYSGGAARQDDICNKDGRDFEEIVELEKEEFIQVMLRLHQANSSRKWRSVVKNAKMEKADLSLNTYV